MNNNDKPITLYYVHDPMCSWCWGFRPVWQEIRQGLPADIRVKYLLGGLAPDTDEPMPLTMQQDIAGYWRKIQQHIPNTEFNFDFWQQCEPRRSTYPACRAIIATRRQQADLELAMIKASQEAYYLQAKNPSNDDTLVSLAVNLSLNKKKFIEDLNAQSTQNELLKEIQLSQTIGTQGFPSMILEIDGQTQLVPLNYNEAQPALDFISKYLESRSNLT
jgi:putative protein-disulfide isomerase